MFKDRYRYESVPVARYIVAYANANKVTINITKAQKLLYITYGACLVFGEDRLCREHPQAWPYGPVFPATRLDLMERDIDSITFEDSAVKPLAGDEFLRRLVRFVFKGFGDDTAAQLTAWSHKEGSPWWQTTKEFSFDWGHIIPDIYIYEYFDGIIERPGKKQS